MTTCRSCGAEIIWAHTRHDKLMPVDAEPVDGGNVELTVDGARTRAVVHAQPPLGAPPLHLSHYVTCPQADEWRLPRRPAH